MSKSKYGGTGMNMANAMRGAKFVAIILATLAVAACAKKDDQSALNGASAAPGSQQDFVVNVGDRVFFDTDSSDLSDQARATLDKQAQWLNNYNRYSFTIEGHADERGTREYNIARGAPKPCANICRRAASRRNACAPSPTARSGRWRCATIFRAGRRTGARSPCSIRAHSRPKFLTGQVPGESGSNRRHVGADCIFWRRSQRAQFAVAKRPRKSDRTGVARLHLRQLSFYRAL